MRNNFKIKIKLVSGFKALVIDLIMVCLLSTTSCSTLSEQEREAAIRANDIAICNNLMSLHAWYHSAFLNDIELEKIWVQTPEYQETAVWAQNANYWIGMDNIKAYYGPEYPHEQTMSQFQFHTTTTGVVEIAGDRKTAKGVWYTPGVIGRYQGLSGIWERYGVDFVRENGEWKIWHLHVYTDFQIAAEQGGGRGGLGGGMGGPGGMGGQGQGMRGGPGGDMGGGRGIGGRGQMPEGMAQGGGAPAQGGDTSSNPDFSPVTEAVDTNGDGRMSREEWTSKGLPTSSFDMFENGRDYVTQQDYEENAAPAGIDMNGDGKLTVEEFIEFDKSMSGGGGPGGPGGAPQGMGMGGPGGATAQPAYIGQWDIKVEAGEQSFDEMMVINLKNDGTLSATWTSQFGNDTISDLIYDNGKITFIRTFDMGDQPSQLSFEGIIEGNNLTGSFSGDMGEIPVTGTKAAGSQIQGTPAVITPQVGGPQGMPGQDRGMMAQGGAGGGMRGQGGGPGGPGEGMGGPGGQPQQAERFGPESLGATAPPGGMMASQATADPGYSELSATSYPDLIPRPPEPYYTFSETWSYGDPNEVAMFSGEYREWSEIKESN